MLSAKFKNAVYSKENGHYKGRISNVSITQRERLKIEIELDNGAEFFCTTFPWPLTPQHEVTKMLEAAGVTAEELASGSFDLNELNGTLVEFDIENNEKNGIVYANAVNIRVSEPEETEE